MEFSQENISSFIKGLLEVGGFLKVEDTPSKYIRKATDESIAQFPTENGQKNIAIYGTMAKDVIIINPFVEGESNMALSTWFYKNRNLALGGLISKTMLHMLDVGARSHSKKAKEEKTDQKAIRFLGKHAVNVDQKMVTEFKSISKDLEQFVSIYYNKTKRCSNLKCALFNESSKSVYPSVRKASWETLQQIFLKICDVKSIDEFKIEPKNPDIPVFESFCYVFLNVLTNLKPALELIGEKIEVEELKSHLQYLGLYQQRARWCHSVSAIDPQAQKQEKKITTGLPTSVTGQQVAPWMPAQTPQSSLPASVFGNTSSALPTSMTTYAQPPMLSVNMTMPVGMVPSVPSQLPPSVTGVPQYATVQGALPTSVMGGNQLMMAPSALPASVMGGYPRY